MFNRSSSRLLMVSILIPIDPKKLQWMEIGTKIWQHDIHIFKERAKKINE